MTECRCGIRHIANLSEELNLASKRGAVLICRGGSDAWMVVECNGTGAWYGPGYVDH